MLLSAWLKDLRSRFSSTPRRLRKPRGLLPSIAQIETLEDRCLLAAFLVTNLNDSGAGSLRQAVLDANGNNNPSVLDTIRFDQALLNTSRIITLTSGQLTITQSVSIAGPSFDSVGILVSGNDNSRVFQVSSSAQNVALQYFTITRGSTVGDGGGLLNQGPNTVLTDMVVSANQGNNGGGLGNTTSGRLEIQRSRLISNFAGTFGGGVANISGTLIINDTTIDSNVADAGGGVVTESSAAQAIITNSTISHNTANSGSGGGIFNRSSTSTALSIQNSTIVGNVSEFGGGGISALAGTVNLMNLTLANNTDFSSAIDGAGGISRIGGGTVTGTNLVVAQNFSNSGNDDTNGGAINGSSSQANFIGGNARLGPLQNNGGLTFTMIPLPGSPVLGNGVTAGTTALDQRGFARNVSSSGNGAPSVDQGAVEFFPTLTQPYVVGPGTNPGNVGNQAFSSGNPFGAPRFNNQSYPGFLGEVRVALADLNGDGTKDIISAPGPGGGPHVLVRNGIDPTQILHSFFAYDLMFSGGVYVAAGDINGDGTPDIITGSGPGGAHVRVFDGNTEAVLVNLFPFGDFAGGVRVAAGDIDNNGRADIIVAAGPGGGPNVKVYNGATVIADPTDAGSLIANFFAYAPSFNGGVFVASGDVNNDGLEDVVTGAGEGGGPHVLVFSNASPNPILGFFAYAGTFSGGVRVGTVDFDGDKFADIVTGAGPGGGPHVRIINGRILTNFGVANDLTSFFPYSALFSGGVYVAGSDANASGGSPLFIDDSFQPPQSPPANITAQDLANVTAAAIARFEAAGVNSAGISHLKNASVELADLNDSLLGLTLGDRIFIDANAAGFGFFVDATPEDDIEFLTATGQALAPEAQGRVDLLTVVVHELAHVLGLADLDAETHPDHLLADRLAPGIRRFLREEDLAGLDSMFQAEDLESLLN